MRTVFFMLIACLLFTGCGTAPGNSAADNTPARQTAKTNYYTGNGGKGVSITVVAPEGKNLGPDDSYLPSLVLNVISGDFTKYSAMSVKDWASLSRVLAEIESVVYAESGDFIEAGNIAQTQYLLTGELLRTGGAYALQMVITDTKTGDNKASSTQSVSYEALASMEAINAAAADLLAQMGITLTPAGKDSLAGTGGERLVEAETALAKGTAAQRSGSTVAALNYYSQAAALQAGLTEADQRLAALTKKIESGDIGDKVRNDIERRAAWVTLLDEAIAFYQQNPYYNVVYYVKPNIGKTDYNRNTVELSYDFWIEPNTGFAAMLKIARALMATDMIREWGLERDVDRLMDCFPFRGYNGNIALIVGAELLNEQGEYIAESQGWFYLGTHFINPAPYSGTDRYRNAADARADWQARLEIRRYQGQGLIPFQIDAAYVSNGMRLSNIRVLSKRSELDYRTGNTVIGEQLPPAGPVRIIPSEKQAAEYFKGRRNVNVMDTGIEFFFP